LNSPYAQALLGGTLIGLSATLLLWSLGRIAGISGILAGLIGALPSEGSAPRTWRLSFVGGLLAGGLTLLLVAPSRFGPTAPAPSVLLACAGLLVGVGTRLGNGCTSGHGICGLARGSIRSLVATMVFMSTGIAAVYVTRHLVGAP
jgi:uncharacterized membrane protein YedE/YeeE